MGSQRQLIAIGACADHFLRAHGAGSTRFVFDDDCLFQISSHAFAQRASDQIRRAAGGIGNYDADGLVWIAAGCLSKTGGDRQERDVYKFYWTEQVLHSLPLVRSEERRVGKES